MTLQIGSRVKADPEHKDFKKYLEQHQKNKGTIIRFKSSINDWTRCKWDNGVNEVYPPDFFVEVDEPLTEPYCNQIDANNVPIIHGQRVYTLTTNRYGYIVDPLITPQTMTKDTLAKLQSTGISIRIIHDKDDDSLKININDLIFLNETPAEVKKAVLEGYTYFIINNNPTLESKINDKAISNGESITIGHYDKHYHKDILSKFYSNNPNLIIPDIFKEILNS